MRATRRRWEQEEREAPPGGWGQGAPQPMERRPARAAQRPARPEGEEERGTEQRAARESNSFPAPVVAGPPREDMFFFPEILSGAFIGPLGSRKRTIEASSRTTIQIRHPGGAEADRRARAMIQGPEPAVADALERLAFHEEAAREDADAKVRNLARQQEERRERMLLEGSAERLGQEVRRTMRVRQREHQLLVQRLRWIGVDHLVWEAWRAKVRMRLQSRVPLPPGSPPPLPPPGSSPPLPSGRPVPGAPAVLSPWRARVLAAGNDDARVSAGPACPRCGRPSSSADPGDADLDPATPDDTIGDPRRQMARSTLGKRRRRTMCTEDCW